jgi:DNA-binding transcriptional ArsR family regulator
MTYRHLKFSDLRRASPDAWRAKIFEALAASDTDGEAAKALGVSEPTLRRSIAWLAEHGYPRTDARAGLRDTAEQLRARVESLQKAAEISEAERAAPHVEVVARKGAHREKMDDVEETRRSGRT